MGERPGDLARDQRFVAEAGGAGDQGQLGDDVGAAGVAEQDEARGLGGVVAEGGEVLRGGDHLAHGSEMIAGVARQARAARRVRVGQFSGTYGLGINGFLTIDSIP